MTLGRWRCAGPAGMCSMSPGPASIAQSARAFLDENFSDWPEDVLSKVLHDNAARIYHLT